MSKKPTKQSRATARRKARQTEAWARFLRSNHPAAAQLRLEKEARFDGLDSRQKAFIVNNYGRP